MPSLLFMRNSARPGRARAATRPRFAPVFAALALLACVPAPSWHRGDAGAPSLLQLAPEDADVLVAFALRGLRIHPAGLEALRAVETMAGVRSRRGKVSDRLRRLRARVDEVAFAYRMPRAGEREGRWLLLLCGRVDRASIERERGVDEDLVPAAEADLLVRRDGRSAVAFLRADTLAIGSVPFVRAAWTKARAAAPPKLPWGAERVAAWVRGGSLLAASLELEGRKLPWAAVALTGRLVMPWPLRAELILASARSELAVRIVATFESASRALDAAAAIEAMRARVLPDYRLARPPRRRGKRWLWHAFGQLLENVRVRTYGAEVSLEGRFGDAARSAR